MSKHNVEIIWLAALLLFPIVLWILPETFFDTGIAICPSRVFFDLECLGCGMTRAVMHFHHFNFDEAVYYNTGVLIVYPVLVVLWFVWVFKSVRRLRKMQLNSP